MRRNRPSRTGGISSGRPATLDEMTTLWKPIRTAPKDGSSIIVAWIKDDDIRQIDIGAWEPLNSDGDLGWSTDRGDLRRKPTHWVPLPELRAAR